MDDEHDGLTEYQEQKILEEIEFWRNYIDHSKSQGNVIVLPVAHKALEAAEQRIMVSLAKLNTRNQALEHMH